MTAPIPSNFVTGYQAANGEGLIATARRTAIVGLEILVYYIPIFDIDGNVTYPARYAVMARTASVGDVRVRVFDTSDQSAAEQYITTDPDGLLS